MFNIRHRDRIKNNKKHRKKRDISPSSFSIQHDVHVSHLHTATHTHTRASNNINKTGCANKLQGWEGLKLKRIQRSLCVWNRQRGKPWKTVCLCVCVFVFKRVNKHGLPLTRTLKAVLVEPIRPLLTELKGLWTVRQTDAKDCCDSSSGEQVLERLCSLVCGCWFQRSVTPTRHYI